MKRVVVVGLGNFGATAAATLYADGHEVIVIDRDEHKVDDMAAHATRSALGDGRDAETLERIGARKADAGIVSTGDDLAASILAVMALRDVGVGDIYVKVISREHARVMHRLGVTETVFPERDSAAALAKKIPGKAVLNFFEVAPDFALTEIATPDEWCGKTLAELDLRRRFGVLVVAVHDVLTRTYAAPDPHARLQDSDALLLAGKGPALTEVSKL